MSGKAICQMRTSGVVGDAEEMALLVEAARSNILSKLTTLDQKKFQDLLRDTFPNSGNSASNQIDLEESIIEAFADQDLVVSECQVCWSPADAGVATAIVQESQASEPVPSYYSTIVSLA